jgi:succinyl-CoA synthetase alpha subunit
MGGDVLAGTNFVDALKIFEHDDSTEGIVLIGEIGGTAELEAAAWIKEYKKRTSNPKYVLSQMPRSISDTHTRPISALIGGIHTPAGRIMGHAGAFTLPGEPDAATKIRHLEDAGVTVVNHPAKFGDAMKLLLGKSGRASTGAATTGASQRRGMHTSSRRIRPMARPQTLRPPGITQKRNLYIRENLALDMLREKGVNAAPYSGKGTRRLLAVAVNRTTRSPCIIASPASDPEQAHTEAKRFSFDYRRGFDPLNIPAVLQHLQLPLTAQQALLKLVNSLVDIYVKKEAFLLETTFVERLGELKVVGANFGFDDAAFRSTKRQADVHALRAIEDEDPQEVEAEKDGIVYIKLAGSGRIGTLVNGAGLAMNTVDALADAGGEAANFLDTGGKATSETVKRSFQLILQDPRVKVIFVNIFGGLTLGDMIARGVLLAFQELEMRLPVVVRIRGTNQEEGQRIVSSPLWCIICLSGYYTDHAPDCGERTAAARVRRLRGGGGQSDRAGQEIGRHIWDIWDKVRVYI